MKANAQKIADGVYWIGVLDWDLRTYHGYTLDGTTYNAYLVFGEDKVALIDNAYPGKTKEMMARIDDAFAQEGRDVKVDYIIQNHVEKDHSGVLYDTIPNSLKLFKCTETVDLDLPVFETISSNSISLSLNISKIVSFTGLLTTLTPILFSELENIWIGFSSPINLHLLTLF